MACGDDLLDVAKDCVDGLLRDDLVCGQRCPQWLDVELFVCVQRVVSDCCVLFKEKKCLFACFVVAHIHDFLQGRQVRLLGREHLLRSLVSVPLSFSRCRSSSSEMWCAACFCCLFCCCSPFCTTLCSRYCTKNVAASRRSFALRSRFLLLLLLLLIFCCAPARRHRDSPSLFLSGLLHLCLPDSLQVRTFTRQQHQQQKHRRFEPANSPPLRCEGTERAPNKTAGRTSAAGCWVLVRGFLSDSFFGLWASGSKKKFVVTCLTERLHR